jgi:hypothetical protein
MNPFITLTHVQDKHQKDQIRINVNHIVLYEQKTYKDSKRKYTYILVQGSCTREVEETPEQIEEMINHAVLSIPFTHIKGA